MPDQDLYDLLASADPATLKMMMDAGLVPSRIGVQNSQPTAEGRTVGPHSAYVASSPIEHLANAVRQVQQQKMLGQVGQGREAYLKMLAGQQGRQAAPQTDPAPMPERAGMDYSQT